MTLRPSGFPSGGQDPNGSGAMTEPRRESLSTTGLGDGATGRASGAAASPPEAPYPGGETPEAGGGSDRQRARSVELPHGIRVRLFDADRTDRELTFAEALGTELSERQLLWVDATAPMDEVEATALAERLDLAPATKATLQAVASQPRVGLHGTYFSLTVATIHPADDPEEVRWLQIVAGRNTVVTVHAEPIAFLDDMDTRIESDTLVGLIDAASFVAALLDAAVTSYLIAADAIQDAVDQLDASSLRRDAETDLLDDLVLLRRRITRLRRKLASHRELFASLGRADFATIAEGDVAAPFAAVAEHFERAIVAVENGRDHLLGSFDVYMTRTAQRTNEIVKVLTIVSVFLLPATVIAGLMGMNLKTPFSIDDPRMFWLVVGLIAVIAISTFAVLRLRRWL